MSNALTKITTRAKLIHRKKKGKWSAAIKQATAELKREGKIGGTSSQVSGHRKAKKRTVKRSRKRSVSNVSRPAGIEGASISSLKSAAKKILKDQLGRKLAQKSLAHGVRNRKKLAKQAAAIRAQLIKFN